MKKNIGSNFDDFLKEENLFDDAEAVAIKRFLACQIQKELNKKHITKQDMAEQMRTSRSSLDRLLDPTNTSITLKTLVRIAHVLGRKINLSFATRNKVKGSSLDIAVADFFARYQFLLPTINPSLKYNS